MPLPASVAKSWRTTTIGILGAVAMLALQAQYFLDGDPNTVISFEAIMAALALLGIGATARDNSVTSETAGATP